VLSTVAFIFVLGVLILAHEFGHFLIAKMLKVKVEIFSVGFGKKLWGIKRGDTDYRICLVPLGGFIKLAGDNPEEKRSGQVWEFLSRPVGERAAIVAAGPLFNCLLAFFIFSLVFFVGFASLTSTVGNLKEGFPAVAAGIQTGDRIISVDGQKVSFWEELSAIIHTKTDNKAVDLSIERDGRIISLKVVPKVVQEKNIFNEEVTIGLIGIGPAQETEIVRYGLLKSIAMGAKRTVTIAHLTMKVFIQIITGRLSARNAIGGPVKIFKITGEAAKLGFVYLLQLMAVLSVNLAIINLFPVPVLDGGHLLFLALEKVRGKPISVRVQEIALRFGVSLLVTLMIFLFYNDLMQQGVFEKVSRFFLKK